MRLRGILLILTALVPILQSAVLTVPNPYATIQTAMDASAPGDTVLIDRGTYAEHLLSPAHGIALMSHYSASGDSADWLGTILDGTSSGTCLEIPGNGGQWLRLEGLVVSNGSSTEKAGGIHCVSNARVELNHVILRNNRSTGNGNGNPASNMVLRYNVAEAIISDVLVLNNSQNDRRNVHLSVQGNFRIQSLNFDGSGDSGSPGYVNGDSLWLRNLLIHDYSSASNGSAFLGNPFCDISGVESWNMLGTTSSRLSLGFGNSHVRSVHVHDSGGGLGVLDIFGLTMDADSILVENCFSPMSDLVSVGRSSDPLQLYKTGRVSHLVVRNCRVGDPALQQSGDIGQVVTVNLCDLIDSRITGNTFELPMPGSGNTTRHVETGAILAMHHQGLDTLIIQNLEVSHNLLIDHDNEARISGYSNLGRALYLTVRDSDAIFMRDCTFHENRQTANQQETRYHRVGSTVEIDCWQWFPNTTDLHIDNCTFAENDDGGLRITGYGNSFISNCVFRDNRRFALDLKGRRAEVQNVFMTRTFTRDASRDGSFSRQAVLLTEQNGSAPSFYRNLTMVDNRVRSLLFGNPAPLAPTLIQNTLIAGNVQLALQGHEQDPETNQPIQFEYCLLPEAVAGSPNNLISDTAGFDSRLGPPWLSSTSLCIDAGDPDPAFQDAEDTDNPGFALWPSLGNLRNDIGFTGGPMASGFAQRENQKSTPGTERARSRTASLNVAGPNPFNQVTSLVYTLVRDSQVKISAYNLRGQRVMVLFQGSGAAGRHRVRFDATGLPSGVYFVELEAGSDHQLQKVLLLK